MTNPRKGNWADAHDQKRKPRRHAQIQTQNSSTAAHQTQTQVNRTWNHELRGQETTTPIWAVPHGIKKPTHNQKSRENAAKRERQGSGKPTHDHGHDHQHDQTSEEPTLTDDGRPLLPRGFVERLVGVRREEGGRRSSVVGLRKHGISGEVRKKARPLWTFFVLSWTWGSCTLSDSVFFLPFFSFEKFYQIFETFEIIHVLHLNFQPLYLRKILLNMRLLIITID